MSKVFTANVILTKSRQAIEQLFFGKNKVTSFRQRIEYLSEKDLSESFIASPGNNEGLLRFEYSFGTSPSDSPCIVKLRFVETSKLLEFVLLDNDPLARKLAHVVSQAKGIEHANYKAVENRSKIETLEDKLDKLKGADQYYMAFGVGDDITNWDGPHSMGLTAATLSNSEGNVRMVDATFVANPDSLKAWSRNFEDELGYGSTVKKLSQYLDSQNYIRVKGTVDIPLPVPPPELGGEEFQRKNNLIPQSQPTQRYNRMTNSTDWAPVPDIIYPVSLNESCRQLLRNFIGAITGNPGNAVVAFPHQIRGLTDDRIHVISSPLSRDPEMEDDGELLRLYGIRYSFGKNLSDQDRERLKALNKDIEKGAASLNPNSSESKARAEAEAKAKAKAEAEAEAEAAAIEDRKEWRKWLTAHPTEDKRKDDFLADYLALHPLSNRVRTPRQKVFTEAFFTATPGLGETGAISLINIESSEQGWRRINPEWQEAFNTAYQKAMQGVPEGMNLDGNGNTAEYTESTKKAKALDLLQPRKNPNINTNANFNAVSEQKNLQELRDKYTRIKMNGIILTLEMGTSNSSADGKYVQSFSQPILAPLSKFVAGLNEIAHGKSGDGSRPFDFFEETDMRILKLWHKYGIITDPTKSAFVFGSVTDIRDTLYLNHYDRVTGMGKISGNNKSTWDSATLKPSGYGPNFLNNKEQENYKVYRKEFEELFLSNKSSRVSSFEVSDEVDDMSFVKEAGHNFDGKGIILKHNTKNPNVTSLSYSTKNYITSLLSMQIRPIFGEASIGTSKLAVLKEIAEKIWGEAELSRFLSEMPAGVDGSDVRVEYLATGDRDKLIRMLADAVLKKDASNNLLFPELRDVGLHGVISLLIVAAKYQRQGSNTNSEFSLTTKLERFTAVKKDIMDRYARQLFKLTVKTLPLFNHKLYVKKTCGLVGMTGGIVGVDSSSRHLAPYTGEYDIVGWKHVISASEISTTLHLLRDGIASIKADVTVRDFLIKEYEARLNAPPLYVPYVNESIKFTWRQEQNRLREMIEELKQ